LGKIIGDDPLTKITEDPQLKEAAFRMEEKLKTFKKLREALSMLK
jgi:hypothetical protein